jgi:hypothetical protein
MAMMNKKRQNPIHAMTIPGSSKRVNRYCGNLPLAEQKWQHKKTAA